MVEILVKKIWRKKIVCKIQYFEKFSLFVYNLFFVPNENNNFSLFIFIILVECNENDRPSSHTTKVYHNGNYLKDSGNSSLSSVKSIKHDDPLSQSLPTWSLKAMKEKENIKCVYDSR